MQILKTRGPLAGFGPLDLIGYSRKWSIPENIGKGRDIELVLTYIVIGNLATWPRALLGWGSWVKEKSF
jgi:hypothetical protein